MPEVYVSNMMLLGVLFAMAVYDLFGTTENIVLILSGTENVSLLLSCVLCLFLHQLLLAQVVFHQRIERNRAVRLHDFAILRPYDIANDLRDVLTERLLELMANLQLLALLIE